MYIGSHYISLVNVFVFGLLIFVWSNPSEHGLFIADAILILLGGLITLFI